MPRDVDDFTDEQMAMFRNAFMAFTEKSEDKTLSSKELAVALRTVGQNPTEQELRDMIEDVDLKNNGKLKYEEFVVMIARIERQSETPDEILESFRVFDKEGNGFISAELLRTIMTSIGEPYNQEEMETLLKECDVDDDGNINYQDFVSKMFMG